MQHGDLEGVGATLDEGVDEQLLDDAQEYAGWDPGEDEPRISGKVIPAFPFYLIKLAPNAALRYSRQKKTPSARVGVRVLEGLEEGVGETIFDDLYLAVSRDERTGEDDADGNAIEIPKSGEKLAEDILNFQHRLNKVARVFGFAVQSPQNKSEPALQGYVSQFNQAAEAEALAIVEIRIERPRQPGATARNRIQWDSLRHLEDPAVDKKLRAEKKTALQEARQRRAEREQAMKGTSASAMRRPAASAAAASIE